MPPSGLRTSTTRSPPSSRAASARPAPPPGLRYPNAARPPAPGRPTRRARAAGGSDGPLADRVEQALAAERPRTAAQRRKGFREPLDRLAADALVQHAGPDAA